MKTSWDKRIGILATSIGLLMLVGFILFAPQDGSTPIAHAACSNPDVNGLCPDGTPPITPAPTTPPTTTNSSSGTVKGFSDCFYSVGAITTPVPDISCIMGKIAYDYAFVLFGSQVTIAAKLLEGALVVSTHLSIFVERISGIKIAWSVFRDTMNILFIFLLLYASIRMILGIGKHETIIKGVITAGLLINFSFFFTSVIIDVSNVFVAELNDAIVTIGAGHEYQGVTGAARTSGISAVFMDGLGLQMKKVDVLEPSTYDSHVIRQLIFSSITYLIIAFVFYAMALLLLVRFLLLIILLITSPIAVMGGFFPQLSSQSKKWWDTLIGQAIFAPLMMLFLTITAVIISTDGFKGMFVSGGILGDIGSFIQYILVIGLLVTSIVVAKQTAGSSAKGLIDWATKTAGAASFGVTAWAGRQTLGRAGAAFADNKDFQRLAASDKLTDRLYGRSMLGIGNYAKSSSFDFRGSKAAGMAGLDKGMVGQAQKGGYEAWYKARQKAQEGRNKGYGAETEATTAEVEEAKLHELRMKEQFRLGRVDKKAVDDASDARAIAEEKAKVEKAQSQQGIGRYDQGTFASTKGSGFGRRAGTLWTAVVNPADRAAAAELEKAAGKDQKKAQSDLDRLQYERADKQVEALEKAIQEAGKEQAAATKDADEKLAEINKGIEKLVEEAKQRGTWDERRGVMRQVGFGGLSQRDQEIQTEIDSLRNKERDQKKLRADALQVANTTGNSDIDQLNKRLENARAERDANTKGREAKERKQRQDDLKVLADKIKEGDDAGKPSKSEAPATPAAEEE